MKRIVLIVLLCAVVIFGWSQPKYVFYFIGDGMGPNNVMAAQMYLAELKDRIGVERLTMTTLPYTGQLSTFSSSNGITDSSAAGTCLATGVKTNNHTLGLDDKGNPVKTIAEKLHEAGWAVGITTSVSIDHATPAAFYAHVPKRNMYYDIGVQLAESQFDFFGGASFYQPESKENPLSPNLYKLCEDQGYTFARGYKEARELMDAKRLILIQEGEGVDMSAEGWAQLPYAINRKDDDLTLAQITETAIHYLQHKSERFFLMVEGGSIDWANHAQDGATSIQEVIDFNQSIELAYAFYKEHPDETLIVITADHETGGMALGNKDYTLNLQVLQYQKCSSNKLSDMLQGLMTANRKPSWEDVKALLTAQLGLYKQVEVKPEEDKKLQDAYKKMLKGKGSDIKTLYKSLNRLSGKAVALLNQKSKLGWTSYSHTAAPVPIYAIGVGAERFTGWKDNSEVAPLIQAIALP